MEDMEQFQRDLTELFRAVFQEAAEAKETGLPMEETAAQFYAIFSEAFKKAADRTGIPVEEIAAPIFARFEQMGRAERWGAMPEDYDPKADPDHPSNGFRGVD